MISFLNLLSNTTQDIVDISFLYRPRFTQYRLMLVFSLPNQCKGLNLPTGEDRAQLETTGFSCHSDLHSEVCITNKPAIVDNSALTTYLQSSGVQVKHMVRPYARKEDETAMKQVTPVLILAGNVSSPACHFNHDVPAVVFSSGGFTGNLFHEFNEVIIPLFITCRQFQSHLQFVISDFKPLWVRKYNRILTHLSRFEVINPATDRSVRCFPAAVIGLKYHENLAVNSTEIPGGYSMFDFKNFLRESYNLKTQTVSDIEKPVLVLISRRKTRTFLNEDEMVGIIEELGFQAIVAKPNRMSNMDKFARVINSCSVMVGAHGAGLANAVFLPAGAVMVQVVPLGLDWASKAYYGDPAGEMGVHYMEYKIEPEESSLFKEYGPHHPVIADPMSIFLQGYNAARAVYVDGQNLTINLVRFRETLNKAMKFLVH
ncbi:alpha-1,3-arabinosyltransferase XAT3-like [Juglans microcarpa x Juglans regia]|uniref:alpha-1,3-arabinosyltransferase XAT3-like n=1 Tax=Juglans microcarpa x Juglans regia TaxID=2249226 RepID=UPI001B7F6744|nr:alpha-1,3-arabinosyltransferase XAT3-like [Juglans microcarpa x Juglans regia]